MLLDMNTRSGRAALGLTLDPTVFELPPLKRALRLNGGLITQRIDNKSKSSNAHTLLEVEFGSVKPKEGILLLSFNPALHEVASVSLPPAIAATVDEVKLTMLIRTFEHLEFEKFPWLVQLSLLV